MLPAIYISETQLEYDHAEIKIQGFSNNVNNR